MHVLKNNEDMILEIANCIGYMGITICIVILNVLCINFSILNYKRKIIVIIIIIMIIIITKKLKLLHCVVHVHTKCRSFSELTLNLRLNKGSKIKHQQSNSTIEIKIIKIIGSIKEVDLG